MTGWPAQPVIYEINTVIWLGELSRRHDRPMTLGDVPAEAWDEVLPAGVDAVWLMGVWERSPAGLRIAVRDQALWASWREALGDLRPDDVVGSPYCVRDYVVAPRSAGLRAWRRPARSWPAAGSACCSITCPTTWPPTIPDWTSIPSASSRAKRPTWSGRRTPSWPPATTCSPAAATPPSRPGRTSSSSTPSASGSGR